MVTDRQIRKAYRLIAAEEGIFVEPASAASLAGVIKLAENGYFEHAEGVEGGKVRVVCVMTGHGLKDPDSAIKAAEEPLTVEAEEGAVLHVMGVAETEPAPEPALV
jgi:threonine synthase